MHYNLTRDFSQLIYIRLKRLWLKLNQNLLSKLTLFLRDHVTQKTGVMMLKIQLSITGINNILKYTKNSIILKKNSNNNSQYYCFCYIFDQINAALMSIRDSPSFKKNETVLSTTNF